MAVRSSQQYIQAVGSDQSDGELRVHRMYVDVLYAVTAGTEKDAENSLNLTQNARGFIETKSVSNNISLTGNLSHVLILNKHRVPDSTLNLTDDARAAKTLYFDLNDTINFESFGGRTFEFSLTNNVSFDDTLFEFNYIADRNPAGNTLSLTQTVIALSNPTGGNTLNLTQNVSVIYPIKPNVSQYIGFYSHTNTPHRAWIEHDVNIRDRARVPITHTITQNISFVQEASILYLLQALGITDSVSFGFGYEIENELDLTYNLEVLSNFIRNVGQDLGVGHALTWFEDSPCNKKQYTPFKGENTISSDNQPDTLRDPQGDTNTFSLYTPYLGLPTSKVTLRKPELDNRDRNAYTRVNHETRGGEIIVYSDPDWPKIRTLAITVVGLTKDKIDELQTFMFNNVGKMIGIDDWEGRLWKGFITNPNEPATQDGKKSWTISFEFEGEMLEVENPSGPDGMAINLTHSVSAVVV